MDNISMVTLVLLVINGLVTYQGLNDFNFFNKYCFSINQINRGEKYRFLTAGFLHVDWMHFIFNMMTLYFFADTIVSVVGVFYFLVIYLVSLLVGNVLTYQFYKHVPFYRAVGASGAIMGVLYASIMLNPDMVLGLYFIIPIPAYLFAVGYLLYSLYGLQKNNDSIGHSAHIGGALAGLLLIILKFPILVQLEYKLIAILLIPVIILVVMYKKNKIG
ncbi:rhomboid family intramembrane serine protease [Myroides marinus]|uniref:Rhomboid family intramembrane serine protease n=1 Tax=Myroides marinus TaxID=703342 RepID=A0A161S973_9FLAO|nr:rhomboid family intramembrane serine protease [Myroides marinus]KZE82004.1 rhomboid family intramembrane serine protease [Myroides marinus]MDM1390596.1 rhomboid family intramembrane serine protease [Myroides marinus]MDM1404222.1 rhomboid family intramembrane serine protease [Myroides marinus]MDM1532591.1 rhomboid family intramembrane serine protease [Myroides marinus]MDM1539640.1 rhomboid family intramembrane serine protease [Myroides marinus]